MPYLYRPLLCRLYMYPRPLLRTIKGEVREQTQYKADIVEQPHSISVYTTLVFTLVQALRYKIIHTLPPLPPARRRAFSCPNQDKYLCLFLYPHLEKGARIQVLLVGVTPRGENTDK